MTEAEHANASEQPRKTTLEKPVDLRSYSVTFYALLH